MINTEWFEVLRIFTTIFANILMFGLTRFSRVNFLVYIKNWLDGDEKCKWIWLPPKERSIDNRVSSGIPWETFYIILHQILSICASQILSTSKHGLSILLTECSMPYENLCQSTHQSLRKLYCRVLSYLISMDLIWGASVGYYRKIWY